MGNEASIDPLLEKYPNLFLIKLFSEIIVKSKSVRQNMIKVLNSNVCNVLKHHGIASRILSRWDKLFVYADASKDRQEIVRILSEIPGIHSILEIKCCRYETLHDIYECTAEVFKDKLEGKTFCVRAKRKGSQEFTSIDAERYVGGGINQNLKTGGVKLTNPDYQINLEIDEKFVYIVTDSHRGLGGYPLSTQEDVLSLISGGFDSGVSTFKFIKRGCRVHYCFFNLGGRDHEIGVKQESHYLWERFGSSHRVKFVAIPFEPVVGEILEKINKHLMGVVLKRMMMRAAAAVAQKMGIKAIVTGESVGQVSSQTITNLSVISECTDAMILRPLVTADKQDIIDECERIGTKEIAESMPEYCGVISQKPATHAKLEDVLETEKSFDFSVLDAAVEGAVISDIRDIGDEARNSSTGVEEITEPAEGDAILDIRDKEESEDNPIAAEGFETVRMPFYKLATGFGDLDQTKRYLLYCNNGVMSRIHSLYLKERGFSNVCVFRPNK